MPKSRKMPKSVLALFAAKRAKEYPRVDLDGINIVKNKRHNKRSRKISRAVAKTVKSLSPKTKHGDVRFNPFATGLRRAAKRAYGSAKAAFKQEMRRQRARARRHVELDGVVYPPGEKRGRLLADISRATGARHGMIRWNPVRDHAEAVRIMRMAREYYAKHGVKRSRFVTKSGRVRTVKAAELRFQGKKANYITPNGSYYVTKKGRKLKFTSPKSGSSCSAEAFNPLKNLKML